VTFADFRLKYVGTASSALQAKRILPHVLVGGESREAIHRKETQGQAADPAGFLAPASACRSRAD
jgi:hypothetical protein